MKITGTRSYIRVEIDGKCLKITGELTTTPTFYADIASIKQWEPPHDDILITEDEKKELIHKITEEGKKTGSIEIIFV